MSQATSRTTQQRPTPETPTPRHWWPFTKLDAVGYLFLLPMVVAVLAFTVYPLVETFRLSFTNSNGVTGEFIGLENYSYVLDDAAFWDAVRNTLYIGSISIAIGLPLSLVIATFINGLPAFQSLAKAAYFAPNVTSAIAAAIAFMYVFYPTEGGWVNAVLGWVGLGPFRWFADPSLARLGVVVMVVWHSLGYTTLIWLAGLQTIPRELYEAATIDRAGPVRRWWHVTVPGLRPIIFFLIVINTIGAFKRFSEVYQIGGSDGQPGGSLTTIMIYIYRTGFNAFDFGRASAASFITFIMILLFTMVIFRLFRGRGE